MGRRSRYCMGLVAWRIETRHEPVMSSLWLVYLYPVTRQRRVDPEVSLRRDSTVDRDKIIYSIIHYRLPLIVASCIKVIESWKWCPAHKSWVWFDTDLEFVTVWRFTVCECCVEVLPELMGFLPPSKDILVFILSIYAKLPLGVNVVCDGLQWTSSTQSSLWPWLELNFLDKWMLSRQFIAVYFAYLPFACVCCCL